MKTQTYKIQDREAGNVIESGLTKAEAEKMLKRFESEDRRNNVYEQDFYEIVEEK